MIDFKINNIFKEIELALINKGAKNISLENTESRFQKTLCIGDIRVGKITISYPDIPSGFDRSDCCDVSVTFDYYVKDEPMPSGTNKFDWFIDSFIRLANAR